MAFEGDLTNLGLADIFQTLGMNRQSGTLVVKHGETERRFFFSDDGVSLLSSRSARKFRLGNLLVGMGKLGEEDLKVAVLKQERAKDTKLGDILLQTDMVKPEDIKEACRYQSAEEMYDTFSWKAGKFQFLEGANAGPAGGPGPFAEFFFEVTDVVMEAARRADEFALNLQKIGDEAEFWIRKDDTPPAEAEVGRAVVLLHRTLDGTMDIRQVFDEFYLSPFDTSQAFVTLLDRDAIRKMGAEDLKAAAAPFLEKKDHARAARMLARAAHHSPEDTELLALLASTEADAGDRKAASRTMTRLGEALRAQDHPVEAVDALRKAVDHDTRNERSYELLMEVHAGLDQGEKAEEACREAARLLSDDRNFEGSLRLLDRGLQVVPDSVGLRIQRANCLLAMDKKDEGLSELRSAAATLEERKERGNVLLGVYRKLHQMEPSDKGAKEKLDALLEGEKRKLRRQKMLRLGAVGGGVLVVALAWLLWPKGAMQRLDEAEAQVASAEGADLDALYDLAAGIASDAEPGSDEAMAAERLLRAVEQKRAAPEIRRRVGELEKRIKEEILGPAEDQMEEGKYPEGIARVISVVDHLTGTEVSNLKGTPEFNALSGRVQTEVQRLLKIPAATMRNERARLQAAVTSVEGVDLPKADDERQRQVFESAGKALEGRDRVDWKGTVEGLVAAVGKLGEIEGVRPAELNRNLLDMEAALQALEKRWHEARALVLARDLRTAYTETLQAVQAAKQSAAIDEGIRVCDAYLERCGAFRKEKPQEHFAPLVDRLFTVLKLDRDIEAERTSLVKAREGLQRARSAEEAGDLQAAFDLYRKTISESQDVNFQGLAMLPLRVESRPSGATLTVTLPGQEPFDAGRTPLVIRYPYQGTTVLKVEMAGFEPSVLERTGIQKDSDAVVTLDLQRSLRWRRESGAAVEGTPGLAPGLVLVGTRGGLFRALAADSGDERFQLNTGHLSGISGGILVRDGIAWFGGNDSEAFAVDLAKRDFLWRRKVATGIPARPVLAGDRVVFADKDGGVHAFDARSGEPRWEAAPGAVITSGLLAVEDRVLAGLADGRLVALDARTGEVRWTATLSGPVYGRLAADGRGGVLAGTEARSVERVALSDGKVTWTAEVPSAVRTRPVMHGGSVVVVASGGEILRLDPAGGRETGRILLDTPVEGGVAALGDRLFIAASAGRLVAFDLAGNRIAWQLENLGTLRGEPAVAPGILVVAGADRRGAVVTMDP